MAEFASELEGEALVQLVGKDLIFSVFLEPRGDITRACADVDDWESGDFRNTFGKDAIDDGGFQEVLSDGEGDGEHR